MAACQQSELGGLVQSLSATFISNYADNSQTNASFYLSQQCFSHSDDFRDSISAHGQFDQFDANHFVFTRIGDELQPKHDESVGIVSDDDGDIDLEKMEKNEHKQKRKRKKTKLSEKYDKDFQNSNQSESNRNNRKRSLPIEQSTTILRKRARHNDYSNDNGNVFNTADGNEFDVNASIKSLIAFNDQMLSLKEENKRLYDEIVQLRTAQTQKHEHSDGLRKECQALKEQRNGTAESLKKQKDKIKQLQERSKKIHKERELMIAKVNLYEGKSKQMNMMSMKELNALKRTLQETIFGIETAREKLDECVVCKENERGVVFVECGHCVLCEGCAEANPSKVCPRCETPYSNVQKCVLY